ncbi:MAG: phage tail protein [Pseudomonadota bacterium]
MGKVVKAIVGVVVTVAGVITGNFGLIGVGISLVGGSLLGPKEPTQNRAAQAATLQVGESPRQAALGRAATAGSLVDGFNYGGKYGTDWEVLTIALADHECDALEGFYVGDVYVAFAGDGMVAGYNNQLAVYWRSGTYNQSPPSILTTNSAGWTANDRGRGVAYVVVAYKADDPEEDNPVWPGGRPQFQWVVRGLKCYDARLDSSVGGSGPQRWDDPSTRAWSENLTVARYTWARGIYAGDRVTEPHSLLVGRGLTEIEAPPANVFARANLCDEMVDGAPRYRIGGMVNSNEAFIDVENDFAAACAGTIVQPEGSVEIDPGEARSPVAHFTDDELLVESRVLWSDFLSIQDEGWINTAVATFVDPNQKWTERSAPPRREIADVQADKGPREQQLRLSFVTNIAQAGRIAEITRRLGRIWGRGQVTLSPRFSEIEEGDWITWQSARRFKGATRTFRVDAWGSDQGWRHQLTLRQISADAYSDTAEPTDGAVATQQPAPGALAAPGVDAWTLSSGHFNGGGIQLPALVIAGAVDDPSAALVRFEYVASSSEPTGSTVWTEAGTSRPGTVRREIPVAAGATYYLAVSYLVDGVFTPRLVLGPVSAGDVLYPNNVPVQSVQPSELGADVTANSQITFDPVTPIAVQANQAGITTTTLPITRLIRLRRGGTVISGGVSVGALVLSGGIAASASVANGVVTVSVTQADAAGTIIVPVTFAGITYEREIVLTRSVSSGTSGGGTGAASFSDTTMSNLISTSYVQVSDAGAVVAADSNGELNFRFSSSYDGNGAADVIARYSSDGGSTWNDVAPAAVGSVAQEDAYVFDPGTGEDYEYSQPGYVFYDRTQTGLTPGADYEVALFARRSGGSGTLNWLNSNFTVRHP